MFNTSVCVSVLATAAFGTLTFVGGQSVERGQQRVAAAPTPTQNSVRSFLRTLDDDKTTKFIAAFRDLNADESPEAIVYLIGPKWCGSGGCSTLVLRHDGGHWTLVSNIRITRPPIYVLNGVSNGWHDIGVLVQGGGVQNGFESELKFDGHTYPTNPSTPPASRLEGQPNGDVVIASTAGATSLY